MPENEAYCSDWGTEKCFIKICVLYSFIHISVQWFERFKKNDNVKASTYLYIHILLSFLGAVFFPPLSVQIEINRGVRWCPPIETRACIHVCQLFTIVSDSHLDIRTATLGGSPVSLIRVLLNWPCPPLLMSDR